MKELIKMKIALIIIKAIARLLFVIFVGYATGLAGALLLGLVFTALSIMDFYDSL